MSAAAAAAAVESKPDNYNINAKICRLVEQYPCMYDRSHAHYLKKEIVDQAWVKIAKEMNDSISSCKERWRNIRTSYARSINVNKIPASANRTKPYYLHEELQFLSHHITPGIPVSRRSNNFYTTSPKSEGIEESIDSYAGTLQCEDEKTQDTTTEMTEQRRSSSSVSEQFSKSLPEIEPEIEPEQMQQDEQTNQMIQPPPMVQIEEEVQPEIEQSSKRSTINFSCAPPKKRLKGNNTAYSSENFIDIKPADVLPQHDYDGIFLQGLLPEMKAMDFKQKLIFKKRVYEVLSEIFDDAQSATSTTSQLYGESSNLHSSTVVNSTDLNMLRRLSTLLQEPTSTPSVSSTPRSLSISSTTTTVQSSPATPSTLSGALSKIGATTRATSTRGRLSNAVLPPQHVKEEPTEGN